jgi:hypothetical protein
MIQATGLKQHSLVQQIQPLIYPLWAHLSSITHYLTTGVQNINKVFMVMLSSLRVVIGIMVRLPVRVFVLRLTIGGMRMRISAVGSLRSLYKKIQGN